MEIEELRHLHEQGFELTYQEQGELIDYADETLEWIAAGEWSPEQSLMGRDIL